jgi:hypothetical protein
MPSTFYSRIDRLSDSVGAGEIVAGCLVNQPYAQNQHQSVWFQHPHGGRALYLGAPLLENAFFLMEQIARSAVTPFGSLITQRMIDVAEWMARAVMENAPVETGVLRTSGSPWVRDQAAIVYSRPPISPREPD